MHGWRTFKQEIARWLDGWMARWLDGWMAGGAPTIQPSSHLANYYRSNT
ncbi:MAG: hypothetical protein ACE5HA_04525 [Anaerolineae bacterium]